MPNATKNLGLIESFRRFTHPLSSNARHAKKSRPALSGLSSRRWLGLLLALPLLLAATPARALQVLGTINPPLVPPVGTVTPRFSIGDDFHGLTYADQDKGYGATLLYSLRHSTGLGTTFFDSINAGTAAVVDRFDALNYDFDALTFAAPDVTYGPVIFYYLRHDSLGTSSFGTITPGGVVGVVQDQFAVGTGFDALTFAATDVGYGANLFYYIRHDADCVSTFGSIDAHQPGTVTDRFTVGVNFDALVFTATDVGYGANLFYYLRHDAVGLSTFGTIDPVTEAVTDRFVVGNDFNELTFTPTDLGFGANLFYYLSGTAELGCQIAPVVCLTNAECAAGATGCNDGTCNPLSPDANAFGCVFLPSDPLCSDNQFCNGAETCDPTLGCQAGTAPN